MSASDSHASVVQDVYANNHIEPPWSHLWAGAIFLGLTLIIVHGLRGIRRARLDALRAQRATSAEPPLRPGDAVFQGVARPVTGGDRERPLVRVEIALEGTERQVGKEWEHQWREVAREVKASPFYLELPGGARLRVEPGDAPFMVDDLEEAPRERRDRRTMFAELGVGDSVIVAGKLERGFDPEGGTNAAGYRDAPTGWILRPRGDVPLLSTEPLEKRHHQRARLLIPRTAGAAVLMLLAVSFCSPYLARSFWGTTVEAQIDKVHRIRKKGRRSYVYTHGLAYHVLGTLPSAERRKGWLDIDSDDYPRLKGAQRMFLRIVPGRGAFATTGGAGASTHVAAIVGGVLVLILGFMLVFDVRQPWYEVPIARGGKGRL